MAFPTTITTSVETYHGVGGPYVSSTGAVYVVVRATTAVGVQIYKAADPASSFSGAGLVNVTSGNTIRHIGVCQVGDTLHIVTRDAAATNSNVIRYHAFDMSSDSFTTSNELVKTTYTQKGTVDESRVGIVVRSAGDRIVMYEGPQVLADIQRARTYYARHLGTAWTADFALDNGGNVDWYPQEIVLGSGNRVHFFFMDYTNSDFYQRTLTSANALETFPAAFDSSVVQQVDMGFQRAVAYSGSAGGTVVRYPYYDSFDPAVNDVQFTSADAPTPLTVTTDITGGIDPGAIRHLISLAKDDAIVYAGFVNNGTAISFNNAAETATLVAANTSGMLLTATANSSLLVFLNVGSGNGTVSAVNVGATPLTRLGAIDYRAIGPSRAEIWGLTAAPTGTLTISAALKDGEVTYFAMAGVTFTGQRTTATPFGTVVTTSGSASAATSIILTSTVGDVVVIGFATDDNAVSLGSNLTSRIVTSSVFPCITVAQAAGASLVTASAARTSSTNNWGTLGINIIASASTRGIYLMSSDDAGSWSTPALFEAGTISSTWTNCFVRNSTKVIGVVYRSSSDLKYTEYTLSVGSSATLFAARLGLLGIGR